MSRGKNLQEMENAVTRGAKPAEKMQTMAGVSYEDLGGPTPENYRPDDDSAKLGTASAAGVPDGAHARNLASVKGVMARKEEVETEEEIIAESEEAEEELIETEEDAEELPEVSDEVDVEEDVNALLGGEELSEEFRDKAKTIFEAALKSKVVEIREALEARYEAQLIEEVEAMKVELVERVDSYLEYVADEWVTENALQIEQGLKTEMTESFLAGMRGLFEEHYVTIPEEKYDVIESMVDKLDEMETKLNEQIERNVALNKRLAESVTDVIFAEVTEGLALSQKDKLASLAENVEFDSESDYREKLVTLRESYFPRHTGAQLDNSDYITEGMEYHQEVSGSMAHYLDALGRVSKK
jgi:hypothetical protein